MIRLLLLFAAVNLGLLAVMGVRMGGDSGIYIDGARALVDGHALTARQPSYLGYIAFVAFFQSIGAGLIGVVMAQVAAATAAAYAVYRMALELGGRLAGVLAVLLFTVDVDSSRWHAYVLSDSLYASVLAIAAWLVHRASSGVSSPQAPKPPSPLKSYAAASLVLLAAGLIRPEGWFVIPAAAGYWIVRTQGSIGRRAALLGAAVVACAAIFAVVAPRLGGNLEAVGPGEMLRRGQTIWDYDGWRVAMPDDAVWSSQQGSGAAVTYAVRHPISTVTLMITRLAVYVAQVRPFYSTAHNTMIAFWLLPLYACAALGLWAVRRQPLAWWCAGVVATQAVVVALTHADYDGRYLAHVMPLIYPGAACGLAVLLLRRAPGVHARLVAL